MDWKRLWNKIRESLLRMGLLPRDEVFYIGGSDTLPPPLEPEAEQRAISALTSGDADARQTLIEHNLRLVVYIAKRFENTGINLEDLEKKINENLDSEDAPIISSRYSLVLAASKRARQLTNGAEPKVDLKADKMLSVAVAELYEGKVNILSAPAEEPGGIVVLVGPFSAGDITERHGDHDRSYYNGPDYLGR